MLWLSVIVAALITVLALVYVVWPLLRPGPALWVVDDDRLAELIGRKDTVLEAIKELEFDYRTGKLSEEDYQRFDQRLRRQAIGLIQQIEKLAPESAGLDDPLEAEIARRRKTRDGNVTPIPEPTSKPSSVVAPRAVEPKAGEWAGELNVMGSPSRFCTNCGHRTEAGHKFCANCGTPVVAQVLVTNS
jgi:hypothetical protein